MNFSSLKQKAIAFLQETGRLVRDIAFYNVSHLKKWAIMEKDLTPEERSVKRSFFMSAFLIGGVMFCMTSVSSALEKEDVDFWPKTELADYEGQTIALAEEGFFAKTNLPTYSSIDRSNVASITTYEVQSGDTIEMIAQRFGVSAKTIINNNTIPNTASLETGLKLKILPVDGVLYEVQSGDTLSSIAQEYDLDLDILERQNQRGGKVNLLAGSSIILPGVEIVNPEPTETPKILVDDTNKTTPAPTPKKKLAIIKTSSKSATSQKTTPKVVAAPKAGKKYVWPVVGGGSVTQGYHVGHYAIDIWGANKPGILSIASGTVTRADAGCGAFQRSCNGGYGNVIVIDHGNGVTSLYAHNTALYVSKGDKVSAGQLIAKMGNSGNVYGKTGVHLHFELSIGGKKRNPLSYL